MNKFYVITNHDKDRDLELTNLICRYLLEFGEVSNTYNSTLKRFGEEKPDFLAAVTNLTDSYCNQLNSELPTPEGVFCQSVGSVLNKATSGKFPLNFSYPHIPSFTKDLQITIVDKPLLSTLPSILS